MKKDLKDLKNIIVRMPNWIGDLVMATPILTDLRKQFPDAEITAMCKTPISDLLEKDKDIDELYSFQKLTNGFSRRKEKRNIIETLKKGKYDLGILLTNSFSSAWWFWQAGILNRIGFKGHLRTPFLTHGLNVSFDKEKEHQVTTYKRILKPLKIKISDSKPRLYLTSEEKTKAAELLYRNGFQEGKILIGIHPGASYGPAKCWPKERFREVSLELLKDPDLFLVFLGDEKSNEEIQKICFKLPERAINLAGLTSLRELMGILEKCDLLLTNDSGPMHIAAALKTKVIALFGSTSDVKTGPYNQGKVINKKVECSPCYKRECPIDFRCMKQISVKEVIQAVFQILHR